MKNFTMIAALVLSGLGVNAQMKVGGTGAPVKTLDVIGSSYIRDSLGVGTNAPTQKLDIVGNVKLSGAFMPNNIAGTTGQILTSAGAGVAATWSAGPWIALWKNFNSTPLAAGTIVGGTVSVMGTGGAASPGSITVPTTGLYEISLSTFSFYLNTDGISNYQYLINNTPIALLADNNITLADAGFRIANFVYRNLNAGDVITIAKDLANQSFLSDGYLKVTRFQ